jgi:hypothetical protein
MSSKKLTLNKETLRTLGAEASEVAGGGLYLKFTQVNTQCCAVVSAQGVCLDTVFKTSWVINPDPVSIKVSVVSIAH